MKHKSLLLSLCLLSWLPCQAQDFPEKDDKGATLYYKVFSAAEGYETLCIQDNTQKTNDYKYLLEEHDPANKLQEWTLQPGDKDGTYLLRNRSTFRYISTSGTFVDDTFSITYASKKDNSNQLLLTPVGDGQYSMTYMEGNTKRFMMVGDTETGIEDFHRDDIYGTKRAWRIYPTTAVPTSITGAKAQSVAVDVIKRRIVVTGADNYTIYDIQGREIPADTQLEPGIYVVQAGDTVRNVSVR